MIFNFKIKPGERVLVMGHQSPDGDSVCSMAAMIKYYNSKHIDARYYFHDNLTDTVSWLVENLHGFSKKARKAIEWSPSVLVVMDCAPVEKRTGFPIEKYMKDKPHVRILNIDHHPDRLGEKSTKRTKKYIKKASSTAELLVNLGLKYPELYTGLATDTGNFEYNYPIQAMKAALKLGLSNKQIEKMRSQIRINLNTEQLKSTFSSKLYHKTIRDKTLMIAKMNTSDQLIRIKLVDLLRGYDYSAVAQDDRMVSLRTTLDNVDMSKLAKIYGGGGHPKASGFKLPDNTDKTFNNFIKEFIKFINKQRGKNK